MPPDADVPTMTARLQRDVLATAQKTTRWQALRPRVHDVAQAKSTSVWRKAARAAWSEQAGGQGKAHAYHTVRDASPAQHVQRCDAADGVGCRRVHAGFREQRPGQSGACPIVGGSVCVLAAGATEIPSAIASLACCILHG